MELTEAVRIVREQTIPALRAMWRDWYPVHVAALETVLVALEQAQAQANVALLDAVRVRSELREMGDERDTLRKRLEVESVDLDMVEELRTLRVERDAWDAVEQRVLDLEADYDAAIEEAVGEQTRSIKAELMDAQHQEALDIEALSKMEAERDALRLAVAKLEDERKFWAGGDAMARLKANDLRAEVERLERARLRSGDWLTLDKLDAEVAAAKDGQIEALRENVDLLAEVLRSHAAILALTGEGR
jgi:hypothetical protein